MNISSAFAKLKVLHAKGKIESAIDEVSDTYGDLFSDLITAEGSMAKTAIKEILDSPKAIDIVNGLELLASGLKHVDWAKVNTDFKQILRDTNTKEVLATGFPITVAVGEYMDTRLENTDANDTISMNEAHVLYNNMFDDDVRFEVSLDSDVDTVKIVGDLDKLSEDSDALIASNRKETTEQLQGLKSKKENVEESLASLNHML